MLGCRDDRIGCRKKDSPSFLSIGATGVSLSLCLIAFYSSAVDRTIAIDIKHSYR